MIDQAQTTAETITKEALEVENFAKRLQIASNDDLRKVVPIVAEIKSQADQVEEKRKSFTEPLNQALKRINDFFKPALDSLSKAESDLKARISAFANSTSERKEALYKAAEQATSSEEAQSLIKQAANVEIVGIKGLQIRELKQLDVYNEPLLIDWCYAQGHLDWLSIDRKAIQKYVEKLPELELPGCKLILKKSIAISAAKKDDNEKIK